MVTYSRYLSVLVQWIWEFALDLVGVRAVAGAVRGRRRLLLVPNARHAVLGAPNARLALG